MNPFKKIEDIATSFAYLLFPSSDDDMGDMERNQRLERAEQRGLTSCAKMLRSSGAETPEDIQRDKRAESERNVAARRHSLIYGDYERAATLTNAFEPAAVRQPVNAGPAITANPQSPGLKK